MKKFCFLLPALLFALPCFAEEPASPVREVRIADTIGDNAVRNIAILLALQERGTWHIQQSRVSLDEGLKGLKDKRFDLVLARVSALPENGGFSRRDYAVEAAMIAVHAENTCTDLSSKDLAEIFSGWRKSWKTLNGEDFQIHLMREPDGSFAAEIFRRKIMQDQSFARAFERKNFMELLQMTQVQPHAATLMARPDIELPDTIRALAVDHIYPSLDHLKNGTYPLSDRRTALYIGTPSPDAGYFLEKLRQERDLLAQEGLLSL